MGGKMPTIQEKIEGTVSKFQSGLEDGKSKIQVAQEISKHKKTSKEASEEKAMLLFRLGEVAYRKLRDGEIPTTDFEVFIEKIIKKDKEIFDNQKAIESLSNSQKPESLCSNCGAKVLQHDKFCGSCGTKVEVEKETDPLTLTECHSCSTQITISSTYCPSCGTRQRPLREGGLD